MPHRVLLAEIDAALIAHATWRHELEALLATGRYDTPRGEIARDDCCALGRWLHGADLAQFARRTPRFAEVIQLHTDFHRCAADVLDLALCGSYSRARALLDGEYTAHSEKLARALTAWKRQLH